VEAMFRRRTTSPAPTSQHLAAGRRLAVVPGLSGAASIAAVAVFAALFLADMLDRNDVLVLGGVEHDHALGRAAGDADALDRAADQLALVGDQHDLVGVLYRE